MCKYKIGYKGFLLKNDIYLEETDLCLKYSWIIYKLK